MVENVGGVDLQVTNEYTIINFAHGTADYLYTESRSVLTAWPGPFAPGTTYWLYWEIDPATGERQFGKTVLEPTYGASAPPTIVGQMWFDTSTNLMKEFNGARWVTKIRVVASKYDAGSVLRSWNGSNVFAGSQVANYTAVKSGAILFDSVNTPLKQLNGNFLTTEDGFTSGVATSSQIRLEPLMFEAESGTNIAAYSVVYLSDFDRILPASPSLLLNNVFGIVEEDAFTGERVHITTSGIVGNPSWNWTTVGADIYIDNTGQIIDVIQPGMNPIGHVVSPHQVLLKTAGVTNVTVNGVSDGVVTAASLVGTNLTLDRSNGLPSLTTDLSGISNSTPSYIIQDSTTDTLVRVDDALSTNQDQVIVELGLPVTKEMPPGFFPLQFDASSFSITMPHTKFTTSDNGSGISMIGGDAYNASGIGSKLGGGIDLLAGNGVTSSRGGTIALKAGTSSGNNAGGSVTLESGSSNANNGGPITLTAGIGQFVGGAIQVKSGNGSIAGGSMTLQAGTGQSGVGGNVTIGSGASTSGNGGNVNITSGTSSSVSNGGNINLTAGNGISGGLLNLYAGTSFGGNGADVVITAGDSSTAIGGTIKLSPGTGTFGNPGSVQILTDFDETTTQLQFHSAGGHVSIRANNSLFSVIDLILPTTASTQPGQVLTSDPAGNLSFKPTGTTSFDFISTVNASGTITIDPKIHWHTLNQAGLLTIVFGANTAGVVSEFTIEINSDSNTVTWPVNVVGDTTIDNGMLNLFTCVIRPASAGLNNTVYVFKVPVNQPAP